MITAVEVLSFVGGSATDTAFAQSCLDEAHSLVSAYVGTSTVPDEIFDRAVLETASELWHRRNSPSGITQYATFDGVPARLAKDPMSGAYPLLHKWVCPF